MWELIKYWHLLRGSMIHSLSMLSSCLRKYGYAQAYLSRSLTGSHTAVVGPVSAMSAMLISSPLPAWMRGGERERAHKLDADNGQATLEWWLNRYPPPKQLSGTVKWERIFHSLPHTFSHIRLVLRSTDQRRRCETLFISYRPHEWPEEKANFSHPALNYLPLSFSHLFVCGYCIAHCLSRLE